MAVRNELLKTFKEILSLSPQIVSVLLPTVLPVELARDLITDRMDPGDNESWKLIFVLLNLTQILDSLKTRLSLDVLTLLFCTGEKPPFQHYGKLLRIYREKFNYNFIIKL